MSVRRFLGAVIAATLAALAAAPKLIWEGGRWILRSFAPPAQARQVESALVAQVEDLVAETETKAAMTAAGDHKADVRPTHYVDLGRAAIQYLADAEHEDPILASMLDDQAKEYLITLPRDRQSLLVNYRPEQIARHLLREVPLINMPRVPTYREYTQALYDRLAAEGHNPDPRIVQSIRKADVDETPEDTVLYGMR